MKKVKVVKITQDKITFDNNMELYSEHNQDCCESHYLCLSDITIDDFDGLKFDLSSDSFFKKIEGYGIELIPIKGHSVKIPGYGHNNGYYSTQLKLVIDNGKGFAYKEYDISDCQTIDG